MSKDIENEIQSWIAVRSFAVEDASPQAPIIDANEIAEFVADVFKKLEGCVVVNSESLLFHAQSIRTFNNGDWENACQEIEEHVCAIEKMLEAVRSGNE